MIFNNNNNNILLLLNNNNNINIITYLWFSIAVVDANISKWTLVQ